ncbi:MAG: pitrilysin family protein [Pyrinomonadaceae bacterium]
MKRTITIFLILASFANAALAQVTPPAATQKGIEIPFVNKVLPNGFEIIVLPDNSVPLVTVEIAVRNGSFTETPELNGLSHLYEHMFFKPNSARMIGQCEAAMRQGPLSPFGQQVCGPQIKLKSVIGDVSYLNEIDQIGIVNNAETHEEVVNYYFTTTQPHLTTAMRFIRDSIRFPVFDEDEFKGERDVVLAELTRHESQPGLYLEKTMMDKLFYKYPTRKQPGGTSATVAAATTEKMRLIQSRYYVPNNSALIVTGDVDPQKVFELAGQLFSDWQRAPDPFKQFPMVQHPPLTKSEGVIVEQPVSNIIMQIGWHGPSIGVDDRSTYAADVFSYIVEQPNSRLQRTMIDSNLAVSTSVHYYTQRNVGPIRMTLVTSPEKAKQALKTLYAEIDKFTDPTYFTDEELENAKTLLEAEDLYRREKLSEYSHTLSFWWSSTGVDYYRGYQKNLRAITRADIVRYIKTYIQNKPHIGVALISTGLQQQAKLTPADLTGGK